MTSADFQALLPLLVCIPAIFLLLQGLKPYRRAVEAT